MVDYGEHYINLMKLHKATIGLESHKDLMMPNNLQHHFKTNLESYINGVIGNSERILEKKRTILKVIEDMSDNVRDEHPDDILVLIKHIEELKTAQKNYLKEI